jgi:serine/threonine protein kinase
VYDLTLPELVPFEYGGLEEGQIFLVRDRVEGQPLADLLASSGPLVVNTAVDLTIRICEILAPAHRAGLVHGSLSPHSILVGSEGQVTVLDCGLLPALRASSVSTGQPWGRFPHLTPEQAAGESVHPASDVYVAGALLYEMLSGRRPFHADDLTVLALQHLRRDPISLQVLVPLVPPSLAQIVHKALAKEPAARYRNAGQLAHILRSQIGAWLEPRADAQATELAVVGHLPEEEKLVVPPPPMPLPPASRRVEFIYDDVEEDESWVDEPEGVDWMMVGLIVAALIAVLGLIPLWRTVYRRYASPPPVPTPASYRWIDPTSDSTALWPAVDRAQPSIVSGGVPASAFQQPASERVELDARPVVWYNTMLLQSLYCDLPVLGV